MGIVVPGLNTLLPGDFDSDWDIVLDPDGS
jgi:hypothetical protein